MDHVQPGVHTHTKVVELNEDYCVLVQIYSNGTVCSNLELWRNGFHLGTCWDPQRLHGGTRKWFNKQMKHHKAKEEKLVEEIANLQNYLEGIRRL